MKCPHCSYAHAEPVQDPVEPKRTTYPHGVHGNFYKLPVEMVRETNYWQDETVGLYGCPVCKKTFVD